MDGFYLIGSLAVCYSHMGTPTLPSALTHFTSEFGMGSGGSTALLSLDKNFCTWMYLCRDAMDGKERRTINVLNNHGKRL